MFGIRHELVRSAANGRCDAFVELVDEHFFALLLTEPGTLRTVFASVPEEWLAAHPRYAMARSILRSASEPFRIPDASAFTRFCEWVASQPQPQTRDRLGVLYGHLRTRLATGRFDAANGIADQALSIIAESRDSAGFPDALPLMLIEIGVAKVQVGDLHGALAAFGDAVRWATARGEHPALPRARGCVALAFALLDDHSHASELLPPELPAPAPRGTPAYNDREPELMARLVIALGHLDRALVGELLDRLDGDAEFSQLWWIEAHARAAAALYWGDRKQGIRSLERTLLARRHLVHGSTMAGVLLRTDLADLNIAVGDLRAAAHALDTAGLDTMHPLVCISAARAALARAQPNAALTALDRVDGILPRRLGILRTAALAMLIGEASPREWAGATAEAIGRGDFSALVDVPVAYRDQAFGAAAGVMPEIPTPFMHSAVDLLTDRELEILSALGSHPTVAALADAIYITPNTVRSHLKSAYRKLGVHSRQQALWELARHDELRGRSKQPQSELSPDSAEHLTV